MSVESIKTRAKKKKPTLPWHKRYRVLIIIMAAFLLVVAAYATITSIQYHNEASDARPKMAGYLENKYGKKFVIENYRVEGDGFAVEGDPTADAYPEENSALRFEVWDRGRYKEGEHAYSDDYLKHLWSQQAREDSAAFIQASFPENEYFSVTVGPIDSVSFKFAQGSTPTFKEALSKYGDQMYYRLSVRSAVEPAGVEPSSERLQQVLKLVRYVADYPVGIPEVNYHYRYDDYPGRDDDGKQRYQYSISAEGEELKNISSVEDVKKYYKDIR